MGEERRCVECPKNAVQNPWDPTTCLVDKIDQMAIIEVFETSPDWQYYNISSESTLRIKEYWESYILGGGPLVSFL